MQIKLYTRAGCKACSDAKTFLADRNIPFIIQEINVDITRDEVLSKFPEAKHLPVVEVDGEWIGSKEQLIEMVNKNDTYDLSKTGS